MRTDEWRGWLDTQINECAAKAQATQRTAPRAQWLYYRESTMDEWGALAFMDEAPDSTWILAYPEAYRGNRTDESLRAWVREIAGMLSILKPEMDS